MSKPQHSARINNGLLGQRVAVRGLSRNIDPTWIFIIIVIIAILVLCVIVTMRSHKEMSAASTKYQEINVEVEKLRKSGSLSIESNRVVEESARNANIDQNDVESSDFPHPAVSPTLKWLLYVALFAGFFSLVQASRKGRRLYRQVPTIQPKTELPYYRVHSPQSVNWRLPTPPRNFVIRREQNEKALVRLATLLCCGFVLAAGFIYAATQHFNAVQYGFKIEELRQERAQILGEQYHLLPNTVQAGPRIDLGFIFTIVVLAGGVFAFVLYRIRSNPNSIKGAPGARYLVVVDFLYSPTTVEETFKPIIADWRKEYFDALTQGRRLKARWISFRYIYRFVMSMALSKAISFIKSIITVGR